MDNRGYQVLDVFSERPLGGNPLAVVVDATGLTDEQMQAYADWTNLSETTFLLPPTDPAADYRVRIFTPSEELPFAGHPTLGSCKAWLAAGNRPQSTDQVVQQCGVGLVSIRVSGEQLAFRAPPLLRSGPLDDVTFQRVVSELGLATDEVVDAAWVDNGPGWLALLLADAEAVLAVKQDQIDSLSNIVGLVGFHPPSSPAAYEVRALFDVHGSTVEDPVTGSLNASVAQWMLSTGRVTAPYVASQGSALGRAGTVHITVEHGDGSEPEVWVGGEVTTVVSGFVDFEK